MGEQNPLFKDLLTAGDIQRIKKEISKRIHIPMLSVPDMSNRQRHWGFKCGAPYDIEEIAEAICDFFGRHATGKVIGFDLGFNDLGNKQTELVFVMDYAAKV